MSEEVDRRQVGPLLLGSLEYVWSRIRGRLSGLTADEYLWEPAPGCWSVRPGPGGGWEIDRPEPEPSPPPVTTATLPSSMRFQSSMAGTSEGCGAVLGMGAT